MISPFGYCFFVRLTCIFDNRQQISFPVIEEAALTIDRFLVCILIINFSPTSASVLDIQHRVSWKMFVSAVKSKINCSSLSASFRETPGLKLIKSECRVSKMLNQVSQAGDKGVYIKSLLSLFSETRFFKPCIHFKLDKKVNPFLG